MPRALRTILVKMALNWVAVQELKLDSQNGYM